MPELLIELLSEEIPARMQRPAAKQLESALSKMLVEYGYPLPEIKTFVGPRRLTAILPELPKSQPDWIDEKKGPRTSAPARAIDGFLESVQLTSVDECEVRSDKKGEYLVYTKKHTGRDSAEIVAEMLAKLVQTFSWSKSMRWGSADRQGAELKWIRPLKRILCVFDGKIVEGAIGELGFSDQTEGHRFMSPGLIEVRQFSTYASKLRDAHVLLDSDEREKTIATEATRLAADQGLEILQDGGLLTEVSGLVEWPVVLLGSFDEKFLKLPDEVLIATMKGHQKYFSVQNPDSGQLANRFICIANLEASDGGEAMLEGYERVLNARLSDAWFLYNEDLSADFSAWQDELEKITFFEGLGSIGQKAQRIAVLAGKIANNIGGDEKIAERAALLSKTDLVSGMVYEFPELQGVMGYHYAIERGEPAKVAEAIRDHYKPAGKDDNAPSAAESVAVAIADKLDTLKSFWSIDKKPTGSSDPFALRRAALGIISLILKNNLKLGLEISDDDLLLFLNERLKVYLRDQGFRHDHVDAAMARKQETKLFDPSNVVSKLKELVDFYQTPEGQNLASAYKRASNILKSEKALEKGAEIGNVDTQLLETEEENSLLQAVKTAKTVSGDLLQSGDYQSAFHALSPLHEPVNSFFESVKINTDDAAVRANRLALLLNLVGVIDNVADFSALEG